MAADHSSDALQLVEFALSEVKGVERRVRVVKQQLAAARDQLQSEEDTSGRDRAEQHPDPD